MREVGEAALDTSAHHFREHGIDDGSARSMS
jgi:hypothetical protein